MEEESNSESDSEAIMPDSRSESGDEGNKGYETDESM